MKNFCIIFGTLLILHVICSEAKTGVQGLSRRDEESTNTEVPGPEVKKASEGETGQQRDQTSGNDDNDKIQQNENGTHSSNNQTKDSSGKDSNSDISYLFNTNSDVVKRMMYVLVGVTGIVVVYFVFRAVRLKRKRSKSKKYGVLTTPGGDMEMAPLDQEDDEDDMTVFDVNNTR